MEDTANSLIVLLTDSAIADQNTLGDYLPLISNCISFYNRRNPERFSELCQCRCEIQVVREKLRTAAEEKATASASIWAAKDPLRLTTLREENDSLIDQIAYIKMSIAHQREQSEAHEDTMNRHKLTVSENQTYIRKLRQKLDDVQLQRNQMLSLLCERGEVKTGTTREVKNKALNSLKNGIQAYAGPSPKKSALPMYTGGRSSQWSHGSSTRPEE